MEAAREVGPAIPEPGRPTRTASASSPSRAPPRVVAPPTRDRELMVWDAQLRVGETTHSATRSSRRQGRAGGGQLSSPDDRPTPTTSCSSRTARRTVETSRASGRARARQRRRIPIIPSRSAPRTGVVEVPLAGGFTARVQVPPDPNALRAVAGDRQRFFACRRPSGSRWSTPISRRRLGEEGEELRRGFDGRASRASARFFCLRGWTLSAGLAQEAPVRGWRARGRGCRAGGARRPVRPGGRRCPACPSAFRSPGHEDLSSPRRPGPTTATRGGVVTDEECPRGRLSPESTPA